MPHEGWGVPAQEEQVIRHHQHRTSTVRALRCARFASEVSAIHASWLSHLTGNSCRGSPEMEPRVRMSRLFHVPRFPLPPAGSASPGGSP